MSYQNDSNSFPMNTWQDSQRGRGGYQVASGASYAPGHDYHERSVSPEPTQSYQAYRPPQQQQGQQPPAPPPHANSSADAAYPNPTLSPFRDPSPHVDTSYRGYEPASPYSPEGEHLQPQYPPTTSAQNPFYSSSYSSLPGASAHGGSSQRLSHHSAADDPFQGQSRSQSRQGPAAFGSIDPNEILDDDDEGWGHAKKKNRITSGAAAGGAGLAAGLGGLAVSKAVRDSSGSYKPVGAAGAEAGAEKSQWLLDEARKRKRRKWLALGIIGVIVLAAIVGGVIGAVISTRNNNSPSTSAEDNGPDLTKDSASIKALMNNKNLHKVFPGMDYTPLNAQYPDCMHNPPSQNNITKDIAVLSQLTPELRLYGTDCNQTEMVLHAIDVLGLGTDLKIWVGVWQDSNDTTSSRQLQQMYSVLDSDAKTDVISGVVVGNEVLFSKYMDESALIDVISSVRTNLTSRGFKIPIATSDLGSNWNKQLADAVDVVMANVHPFFGGIPVDQAAGWTWDFWQNNDVAITAGTDKKHTISEVGWPSAGGNDCSDGVKCPDSTSGAVAGIDEMNKFMNDWVCQSLTNQTSYFWFEAFDEPWKIRFNQPGQEWEDQWGLMDVNRNLKKGLQIPDCGGQTAGATTWPAPMGS